MFSISALFRVLFSLGSGLLQELIHIVLCDDGVRNFVVLRHILAGHQRLAGIHDTDVSAVQIGDHRGNAGAVGLDIIEDVFDKEEYEICLSKYNEDLTKEFNEALNEL